MVPKQPLAKDIGSLHIVELLTSSALSSGLGGGGGEEMECRRYNQTMLVKRMTRAMNIGDAIGQLLAAQIIRYKIR